MFYGRVDVYWPDRPMESYRINKETVAIGRSTGNDIVLDSTTVSRYHITLTFHEQHALLEDLDSVNGTYVDGKRLRPHEPLMLRGGEEVQVGEARLIYHPPVPSGNALAYGAEDVTQRVELSRPSYRVALEGPDMPVAPGAHVQATLTLENVGDEDDRYFIEIVGLPKGWARAERVELPLAAGEEAQIVISFKPLRRSDSAPGERPFTVRVRSQANPAEVLEAPAILHVLPFSGFGMALETATTANDGRFTLYLHNQGNAPLSLTLQGVDAAQTLWVRVPSGPVHLAAGERRTVGGTVRPRKPRWFGQAREHAFVLQVHANNPSGFVAALPGRYVEQPRLPQWAAWVGVPMLVLLVVALLGGVVWAVRGTSMQPPPPPEIISFDVDRTSISLGEQVVLSWSVQNADALTLITKTMRGQRQYTLSPDMTGYALTPDQTGIHTLILEAHNGKARQSASAYVEVRPVVTLEVSVPGSEDVLVRNVQHEVLIRWSVVGAREYDGGYTVWLESSDVASVLHAPPMPLTGEQRVTVIPAGEAETWAVTLYAEGWDQVLAHTTQALPVIYPVCELRTERAVVYSGPGETYPLLMPPQSVGEASGTISYSPIARDPSGAWLQVLVGVENPRMGWVQRADFVCANFDPARLVVSGNYPPPPTPTQTLSPKPTATTPLEPTP